MTEPIKTVFLSYASEDAPAAQRIGEVLRSAGITVWFDQSELRGGDAWDHKIRREIHECGLFIPIISENTEARPEGYFRLEWDLADQRSHMIGRSKAFIVPVCIDRVAERGADVPDSFLKAQWVRLPAGEASPSFAARIAALLASEGASRPRSTAASHSAASVLPNSFRWRTVLVLASVLAAVAFGWQAWRTYGPGSEADLAEMTPPTVSTAAATVPEKSIAVLPFLDMSPGKDQEYMSDGIAEEILNLLAQVPDFKVIARTSSFSFKGKNVPIAEIAKQLNVGNVLEGSVRKSGDTLRITAQLIHAADSTHLWSSSYDRPLTDIFAVQTEIANAIVQALQIGLMGGKLTRRRRYGESRGVSALPARGCRIQPEFRRVPEIRRRAGDQGGTTRPGFRHGLVGPCERVHGQRGESVPALMRRVREGARAREALASAEPEHVRSARHAGFHVSGS